MILQGGDSLSCKEALHPKPYISQYIYIYLSLSLLQPLSPKADPLVALQGEPLIIPFEVCQNANFPKARCIMGPHVDFELLATANKDIMKSKSTIALLCC